jgi:hypothetical protein
MARGRGETERKRERRKKTKKEGGGRERPIDSKSIYRSFDT